jgi:hypothetical protein
MKQYMKHVATAVITDPVEVQQQCTAYGIEYYDGSIFCTVPEIGLKQSDYIYCRYGLSIPYIRIQEEWKVLIEPTIIEASGIKKRWFYTGLVDCGGDVAPDADMQMMIQLVSQVIYATTNNTLHLSAQDAEESFVLGNAFKTELDKHYKLISDLHTAFTNWIVVAQDGGAALKTAAATFISDPLPDYSNILSTKIFGE